MELNLFYPIDEELIKKIFKAANFNEKNGIIFLTAQTCFSKANKNSYGFFFPFSLSQFCDDACLFTNFIGMKGFYGAIAMSKNACKLHEKFPAYFTYLVAHEIGHAKIYRGCEDFNIHSCLVNEFITYSKVGLDVWETPIERCCDELGKYIAESLYGKDQLRNEIHEQIKKKNYGRDRHLLDIKSDNTLSKTDYAQEKLIIEMSNKLVEMTKPFENQIIQEWQESEMAKELKFKDHKKYFQRDIYNT